MNIIHVLNVSEIQGGFFVWIFLKYNLYRDIIYLLTQGIAIRRRSINDG